MPNATEAAIQQLCERLQIDSGFFAQCLQESVVEIHEVNGRWELANGTIIRLRRLERICNTLNVGVTAALLVLDLTQKVTDLEEEVHSLHKSRPI